MANKTLYLVRHAKSDWNNHLSDFDRPLNKRGLHDAPEMGRRLKARTVLPNLILCSPATRATQTMELLVKEMNCPVDLVQLKEGIYEAGLNTLLYLINEIDEDVQSAMLIGHNPAMSWLADELSGERIGNMPTCAVVTLNIPDTVWAQVGAGCAELVDFDFPKKVR